MQVETFECSEVSAEPVDASAEALSIIESLGLEGQKELMCPAKADEQVTRFPYREMLKEEVVVYQTLCPKDSKLKDYTGSAIPLRVLQIAAHASELMPDLELHVWDRDSAIEKDPVLVAERKEGYLLKARYILARWGEELEAFAVLAKKAAGIRRAKVAASARSILKEVDEADDSEVLGKRDSLSWW